MHSTCADMFSGDADNDSSKFYNCNGKDASSFVLPTVGQHVASFQRKTDNRKRPAEGSGVEGKKKRRAEFGKS